MRTAGIIIFFIIFTYTVNAQYSNNGSESFGSIKGNIIDSISSQPLEYASLSLIRSKDSAIVQGTITNEKGAFVLEKIPFGLYFLKISFIGYRTLKISNVFVNPKKSILNLGTIKIKNSEGNLAEVVITGEKQMEEYSLDKKIINVDKNITSAGGTAVDVLRNVPSITIDADNVISLRGQTDVKILVDGRPSTLTSANLEQIPASSIESVEVITNPSAKYNPEGMAGIINIKMKKKKEAGFNGVASIGAATGDKYNASINLNYNLKKINLFGSYDFRKDDRPAHRNATTKTTPQNDTSTYQIQNSTQFRKSNTNNFKFGMDYFINSKNTITFSVALKNSFKYSDENIPNIDSIYAYSNNKIISSSRKYFFTHNLEPNNDNNIDYTLNYKKTFDKKGKELTADMIYTTDNSFMKQYIVDTSNIFTQTLANTSIANLLINFVNPLSKPDSKYEIGLQSTMTNIDDQNTYHLSALNYDFNHIYQHLNVNIKKPIDRG